MSDPVLEALEAAAIRWSDPAYPARSTAIEATLGCDNRFTLEAVAFAVDQQMSQISRDKLDEWRNHRSTSAELLVGVVNAGNVPFAGLQDLLAVIVAGHQYLGVVSTKSPALLPAFVADCGVEVTSRAQFASFDEMIHSVDALIATGTDETMDELRIVASEKGIDTARTLLRGNRFSVAIMDGKENDSDLEGLAEDILLHEGLGCRNVAIVFAPESTSPDPLLEAMARFRAVFPAHERTPGSLTMHRAMLAAVDAPHAHGTGLEFLVSKGEPEVQAPGHLRWSTYADLKDATQWIIQNHARIQVVVARRALHDVLSAEPGRSSPLEVIRPGTAQRPPLDWKADGIDTMEFLTSL